MIKSRSNCLILAAVFQVIFGQAFDHKKMPREDKDLGIYHPYQHMIPSRCWHPPRDIDLYKCCPRPHLYSDEVLEKCGVEPLKNNGSNDPANVKPIRIYKAPCQDGLCLMQNANLLNANGSIDYKKLGIYLDKWAAENPDFTEAILAAKPICGRERDVTWSRGQPPLLCDPDRVFICLRTHMLWNCKLKEFEECQRLGEHMQECKPYYEEPKKQDEKSRKKH